MRQEIPIAVPARRHRPSPDILHTLAERRRVTPTYPQSAPPHFSALSQMVGVPQLDFERGR